MNRFEQTPITPEAERIVQAGRLYNRISHHLKVTEGQPPESLKPLFPDAKKYVVHNSEPDGYLVGPNVLLAELTEGQVGLAIVSSMAGVSAALILRLNKAGITDFFVSTGTDKKTKRVYLPRPDLSEISGLLNQALNHKIHLLCKI